MLTDDPMYIGVIDTHSNASRITDEYRKEKKALALRVIVLCAACLLVGAAIATGLTGGLK